MQHGTVADTLTETFELVAPGDLNIHGTLFGGRLLSIIDKCAGLAAFKHARTGVVTIALDEVEFQQQVPAGAILTVRARVNRSFNSSMEVGCKAWMQDTRAGKLDLVPVCRAFLTFVALDREGNKVELPAIVPESSPEKKAWEQAAIRREHRIALREKLHAHGAGFEE